MTAVTHCTISADLASVRNHHARCPGPARDPGLPAAAVDAAPGFVRARTAMRTHG